MNYSVYFMNYKLYLLVWKVFYKKAVLHFGQNSWKLPVQECNF